MKAKEGVRRGLLRLSSSSSGVGPSFSSARSKQGIEL